MVILCICLAGIVVILEILGYIAIKDDKPAKTNYSGCFLALVHNVFFSSTKSKYEAKEYYEKIYIGKDWQMQQFKTESGLYSLMTGIMFGVSALYLLGTILGSFEEQYVSRVNRPSAGSAKVNMVAEYDGSDVEIEFDINSLSISEQEKDTEFKEISKNIDKYILGDNKDISHITRDLVFKGELGKSKIKAYYDSSDYSVIDGSGNVYSESLVEQVDIVLTVRLSLEERTAEIPLYLTVCPLSKETKDRNIIVKSLEELALTNYDKKQFDLPKAVDGKSIKFKKTNDRSEIVLLFLGIIVSILIIPYGASKRKEKLKHRDDELVCDYPELISKMTLLLEAGLTIRGAFERIASDYEKRKQESHYLYEEMAKSCNEMALGIAEPEAYERFGKRCGLVLYIRFAQLLSTNVKKGGESLLVSLKSEAVEAQREKKEAIKKKGEEIRMKLLIPMMGMLCLIVGLILGSSILSMK